MCWWFVDTALSIKPLGSWTRRNGQLPAPTTIPITTEPGGTLRVGEHNPTAAGAFQAGTEFRNHGLGLNQDVSLRPAHTTATPQPSPRTGSERDRHMERDGETGLAALPRSSTLITFVVIATGSAINGINCGAMPRCRLSKPDHDR